MNYLKNEIIKNYIAHLERAVSEYHRLALANLKMQDKRMYQYWTGRKDSAVATIVDLQGMISDKTEILEDLGFKFIEDKKYEVLYTNYDNKMLVLYDDGNYVYGNYINQELHTAIELKMKELGWWK